MKYKKTIVATVSATLATTAIVYRLLTPNPVQTEYYLAWDYPTNDTNIVFEVFHNPTLTNWTPYTTVAVTVCRMATTNRQDYFIVRARRLNDGATSVFNIK